MGLRFTAEELLQIAERIERNAVVFYAAAANSVAHPGTADLLRQLSTWEGGHAALFAAMRQSLSEREREAVTFDPDDEIALYLQAMADGTVFPIEEDPAAVLGPAPTLDRVFELALTREHESIVYYTGMRSHLPPALGRDKLDHVIREEFGHITHLQQQRRELGQ